MKRILSGVRPTGHIHLGNYLGALKQWVKLSDTLEKEDEYEQLFCIVDQHALTSSRDAENLASNTLTIAAAYIACGIDVEKSSVFIQSHVSGHAELAWYLGCITPMGWLNRMTQFKDKARKAQDQACLGLYAYPVLMAADILLYQSTHVPVGEDQKQHVELARDIGAAFNRHYGADFFSLPEPMINKETARIMSLRDGTQKMSKSDLSDYSRINLMDDNDQIALKIKKAKTDSDPIPEQSILLADRPEAKNLLTIYGVFAERTLQDVCSILEGKTFSAVKNLLTDMLIAELSPIRKKIQNLLSDQAYLKNILVLGAEKANLISAKNITDIKKLLGMVQN